MRSCSVTGHGLSEQTAEKAGPDGSDHRRWRRCGHPHTTRPPLTAYRCGVSPVTIRVPAEAVVMMTPLSSKRSTSSTPEKKMRPVHQLQPMRGDGHIEVIGHKIPPCPQCMRTGREIEEILDLPVQGGGIALPHGLLNGQHLHGDGPYAEAQGLAPRRRPGAACQ